MSHFLVLVAGDDPEYQLAPFHEYECTGVRDEFVVPVDVTEEYRKGYNENKKSVLVDPAGVQHSPWDDQFFRDPEPGEGRLMLGMGWTNGKFHTSKDWGDGLGYRPKIAFVPDGWTEAEVPYRELITFEQYLVEVEEFSRESESRYLVGDGDSVQAFKLTNPNSKWDWWQIGGRYSGRLILKSGDAVDQAKKGEVDWFAMERNTATDATDRFIKARAVLDQHPEIITWEAMESIYPDISERRTAYRDQPGVKAFSGTDFWSSPDDFQCTLQEYIRNYTDGNYPPGFAVLKDRKWDERGEMGWFAIVSDEKQAAEWASFKREWLASLPDDTLLTVVDCHI